MIFGRVTGRSTEENRGSDKDVLLLQVELTEENDADDTEWMTVPGIDSNPPDDTMVLSENVTDSLLIGLVGDDGIEGESEPGEIEMYGSAAGAKTSKVKCEAGGDVKLNDGTKEAAYKDGAIRIDAITDPNLFTWLIAVGSFIGTPPPTTITGKIVDGSPTVKIP